MRRLSLCGMFLLFLTNLAVADPFIDCSGNSALCTERYDSLSSTEYGGYTGHDEPSLLFYSNVPGSGNSSIYRMKIPTEPSMPPNQAGTGGTYNFQLHPAFWFGMAMCDNQSAPNYSNAPCTPNSDSNIFDSADPADPHYIGKHPGTAFMEMQFYPPGWVFWPDATSCDSTKWCAALTIDSLNENQNTGELNNAACLGPGGPGLEPVNFAFITKNGVPLGPPGPLTQTLASFTPDATKQLLMNPGDDLVVTLSDTPAGFQVVIQDLTTGESGSMVASAANGFAQVEFKPTAATCTQNPYSFHPMYATSSEQTRVVWAAHSYNIAFSDEIGHWEYCNDVDCSPPHEPDDDFCLPGSMSSLIKIGGCTDTDVNFDGVGYQATWPGTIHAFGQDKKVHPSPVVFSSPRFMPTAGGAPQDYDRVAFETDLPRIENATNPPCDRFSPTGTGCVNPPVGATFYPIFTTTGSPNDCRWQLGGANLPGTKDDFGGNSTVEYGPLLRLNYPGPAGSRFNDFRQVLSNNPCTSKKN